jgi:outer membrane biosynthesis protein TonB
MISRTLVPVDVRPVQKDEARKPGHRLTTYMDDRTVVPSGLSEAPPLDGHTNIPQHLPLGVLVNRTLVYRGMPITPLPRPASAPEPLPLDILDSRVVVPAHVEPMTHDELEEFSRALEMTDELREVVEPDLFLTGDANLLIEPEDKRDPRSDLVTRVLSILVHVAVIIFLAFSPKIFPPHVPTQQEVDLARKQLTYVLPEEPPAPARPPAPKVHITPKTLEKVAPPVEQPPPPPAPAPAKQPVELPEAPKPQPSIVPPPVPPPSQLEAIKPQPQPNPNRLNLDLPQVTPGKAIQDQLQDAIHHSGGGLQVPDRGGIARGGGGGPGMEPGATILTDTQGVDFTSYIQRLLATLKRNWETVMPESALLGDKGMVYTTFQINHDGSVPSPDPQLERTSGKDPLDNAAMSAIHTSNPFEPLPSQFKGPYIRLRIVFLYNLPLDYAK